MLIEIKIPVFAESVTEGTIAALHKKVGDAVARDENLADIETDKIMLELPAPQAGVLVELTVAVGDTVLDLAAGEEAVVRVHFTATQVGPASGVVTLGALIGMAAHIDGKGVTVLDMTGLAQKGGAVFSHVRICDDPEAIHAVRVATGDAEVITGVTVCSLSVINSSVPSSLRRNMRGLLNWL